MDEAVVAVGVPEFDLPEAAEGTVGEVEVQLRFFLGDLFGGADGRGTAFPAEGGVGEAWAVDRRAVRCPAGAADLS